MPTGWPQPLQVPIIRLAIGRHARGVPRLKRWLGPGSDWRAGAHHEVSERLHDLLRRRPGLAVSDRPAVDLNDRCDFSRGTRDERLVRGPDIVQGEELLLRRQVEAGSELGTVSRVTPGRFVDVNGVTIVWFRTMKTFSALASET